MDEQTIQSIVNSVLRELGEQSLPAGQVTRVQPQSSGSQQNNPPAYKPSEAAGRQSAESDQGEGLEDLSLDKFIHWNGIENAHNAAVNSDMVKQTRGRAPDRFCAFSRITRAPKTLLLMKWLQSGLKSRTSGKCKPRLQTKASISGARTLAASFPMKRRRLLVSVARNRLRCRWLFLTG